MTAMVFVWPFVIAISLYSMIFAWIAVQNASGTSRVSRLVWLIASAASVIFGFVGLQSAGGMFTFRFASGLVVLAMAALGVLFAFVVAVASSRSRNG